VTNIILSSVLITPITPVALEKRKIYALIPDAIAEKHNQVRVIDESGEDYLYPASCFIPINLSKGVENAILRVA